MEPTLTLEDGIGGRVTIEPPRRLVAGRKGDFIIGEDDAYLHRRMLMFWYHHTWQVKNIGTGITITLEPMNRRYFTQTTLGPGGVSTLPLGASALVFSTTERTYQLDVFTTESHLPPDVQDVADLTSDSTVKPPEPNREHLQLMRALAAPLLRNPGTPLAEIPQVKDLATQLGWTEKKVNQKIDHLCNSLAERGNPDFQSRSGKVFPRRLLLARYAAERLRSNPHWAAG